MLNKFKKIIHPYIFCEHCGARIQWEINSNIKIEDSETVELSIPKQSPLLIPKKEIVFRPGKITRNPFFNFLRVQRQTNDGHSILDIARQGAIVWQQMTPEQKCPFIAEAHKCPRKKYSKRYKYRRVIKREKSFL